MGALFGAAVAPVFELARPLRACAGTAAADAVGTAVDAAGGGIEFAVLHGEAQVPALRRIEVHAEGVGDAGAVVARVLQVLAFVVQVDLAGQAPALAQCPTGLQRAVEQRIDLAAVAGVAVGTVQRMVRGEAVFGFQLGAVSAAAATGFRADAGAVPEQVFRAQREQVVLLVGAAVVVEGELADAVQLQRRAEALAIAQCRQQRFAVAGQAFLADAAQLGTEASIGADLPVRGQLALFERLRAALGARPAAVHAEAFAEIAAELRPVFLDAEAEVGARHRVAGIHVAPPGADAPALLRPTQFAQIDPRLDRACLAVARTVRRVALDEAQAAVVGIEDRRDRRFAAALLDLEVGATPGLQGQVDAL